MAIRSKAAVNNQMPERFNHTKTSASEASAASRSGVVVDGGDRYSQRQRQHHDVAASRSISTAKEQFVSTVRDRVSTLMEQCGYNRERAISALLREIGRGEKSPSDDEVIETMQQQTVGIEEAGKVLTVSRTLKRLMSERGISVIEAIDEITSRLSLSNLVKAKATKPNGQLSISTRTPEVRIEPVGKTETSAKSERPPRPKALRKPKSAVKAKSKASLKSGGGRKRAADEGGQGEKIDSTKRERRDTVLDEVDAKIAAKGAESDPAPTETNAATPIVVRSKRSHLGDDLESQPALKRARTSNDV